MARRGVRCGPLTEYESLNMSTQKELAVVVGATGAFGRQIVARLSASDLDVVAVARSAEALDELVDRHPGLIACVADIASATGVPQETAKTRLRYARAKLRQSLEVLV